MKIVDNIKKYSKPISFSLTTIGAIGTILGISLFTGGGMHGIGIPDISKDNSKNVQWTRVSMGFINFKGTGELLSWLKSMKLVNLDDSSITFNNFINISKNNNTRNDIKNLINISKEELNAIDDKGAIGVKKQLQVRTQIDLMENLLLAKSMYQLSISGMIIMPISIIILAAGIFLVGYRIRKDKKETRAFIESLNEYNKNQKSVSNTIK